MRTFVPAFRILWYLNDLVYGRWLHSRLIIGSMAFALFTYLLSIAVFPPSQNTTNRFKWLWHGEKTTTECLLIFITGVIFAILLSINYYRRWYWRYRFWSVIATLLPALLFNAVFTTIANLTSWFEKLWVRMMANPKNSIMLVSGAITSVFSSIILWRWRYLSIISWSANLSLLTPLLLIAVFTTALNTNTQMFLLMLVADVAFAALLSTNYFRREYSWFLFWSLTATLLTLLLMIGFFTS